MSSTFSYEELFLWLKDNNPDCSINILQTKYVVEYPLLYDNPDFEQKDVSFKGAKLLKVKCLRRFPPYIQKNLIEFESREDYLSFRQKYGN